MLVYWRCILTKQLIITYNKENCNKDTSASVIVAIKYTKCKLRDVVTSESCGHYSNQKGSFTTLKSLSKSAIDGN